MLDLTSCIVSNGCSKNRVWSRCAAVSETEQRKEAARTRTPVVRTGCDHRLHDVQTLAEGVLTQDSRPLVDSNFMLLS